MSHHTHEPARQLNDRHRRAVAEAKTLLSDAAEKLRTTLQDEPIIAETPLEAEAAMTSALTAIVAAVRCLKFAATTNEPSAASPRGRPTRQQGQFLAFIREYTMRSQAGIGPSHAELQRFFNVTPPSVNSMLIRLEQRQFIRRIPGKARAIELIINPDHIPPLDRPFRL